MLGKNTVVSSKRVNASTLQIYVGITKQNAIPLNPVQYVDCHECSEKFKRFSEMMLHKKNQHPEKVRACKDPVNCEFKTCWFLHIEKERCEVEETENMQNTNEINQDFQLGQAKPKPPISPTNKSPNTN